MLYQLYFGGESCLYNIFNSGLHHEFITFCEYYSKIILRFGNKSNASYLTDHLILFVRIDTPNN